MASISNPSSCVYHQVFRVTPLLGGLTTYDSDFTKSTFEYQPYVEGMDISVINDSILVKSPSGRGLKSILYYRELVVFRDSFKRNPGFGGCSSTVDIIDNPPVMNVISGDKLIQVSLTIGTLLFANQGEIVVTHVKMDSFSNKKKIAQFLHNYISNYDSLSSKVISTYPCNMEVYLRVVDQTNTRTTYLLYLTQVIPCTFKSWHVAIHGSPSTSPVSGTINKFYADFASGGQTAYQVGYVLHNGYGKTFTIYSNITFPLVDEGIIFDPNNSL